MYVLIGAVTSHNLITISLVMYLVFKTGEFMNAKQDGKKRLEYQKRKSKKHSQKSQAQ
jgi:hypothetical protein